MSTSSFTSGAASKRTKTVVQRRKPPAHRFQAIKEVHDHFRERQFVGEGHLTAGELRVPLDAPSRHAEIDDIAKVGLRNEYLRLGDGFAQFGDLRRLRQREGLSTSSVRPSRVTTWWTTVGAM